MGLSQEELQFRPFEPLPFSQPAAEDIASGLIRETDAHAALQTHLALEGVESFTPDTAETLLSAFGLNRNMRRAILIELWQHAFKKLLFRDDQVDTGEAVYLDKLKLTLGLTDEEVKRVQLELSPFKSRKGSQ